MLPIPAHIRLRCAFIRGLKYLQRMLAQPLAQIRADSWELSGFRVAASLIDKAVAAGSPLALCDIVRGLLLGNALLDHVLDCSVTHAGIFQLPEHFLGKHGQVLRAALRDGQNHLVGKTREAQGLRLTRPVFSPNLRRELWRSPREGRLEPE